MQIESRIKALEAHLARQDEKAVRVIRGADETDEQAIQREGVELSDNLLVIIRSIVKPGQIS